MAETTAGTALAPLDSGPRAIGTAQPLSAAAMHYARQSLSPATRRAYASHLRAWEAWCQSRGALPCPAAAGPGRQPSGGTRRPTRPRHPDRPPRRHRPGARPAAPAVRRARPGAAPDPARHRPPPRQQAAAPGGAAAHRRRAAGRRGLRRRPARRARPRPHPARLRRRLPPRRAGDDPGGGPLLRAARTERAAAPLQGGPGRRRRQRPRRRQPAHRALPGRGAARLAGCRRHPGRRVFRRISRSDRSAAIPSPPKASATSSSAPGRPAGRTKLALVIAEAT